MKRRNPSFGSIDVVRERVRGDVDHVTGAFLETSPDLEGRLRNRPADLPRQLRADRIGALDHQVGHASADRRTLGQRHPLPPVLRTDRSLDGRLDLGVGRQIEFRVDGPVHRADDALFHDHSRARSPPPVIGFGTSSTVFVLVFR